MQTPIRTICPACQTPGQVDAPAAYIAPERQCAACPQCSRVYRVAQNRAPEPITGSGEDARRPQPGDAVRLDSATYYGAREGAIAIIDSTHYDWEGRCLIVFGASAFRGKSSKYSTGGEFVECSGGPCPLVRMADLKPAGTHEARFWRWQDVPRAHGGEDYTRTVPLWSWDGLTDLERAERELWGEPVTPCRICGDPHGDAAGLCAPCANHRPAVEATAIDAA